MMGRQVYRLLCFQAIGDGLPGEEGCGKFDLDLDRIRLLSWDSILEYDETWEGVEGNIILNLTPN